LALWKGNLPNIYRNIAMSVGMLGSYDQAKQFVHKHMQPGLGANFTASCIAGFIASVFTLPVSCLHRSSFVCKKTCINNVFHPVSSTLSRPGCKSRSHCLMESCPTEASSIAGSNLPKRKACFLPVSCFLSLSRSGFILVVFARLLLALQRLPCLLYSCRTSCHDHALDPGVAQRTGQEGRLDSVMFCACALCL
jgi:hypothetical protein